MFNDLFWALYWIDVLSSLVGVLVWGSFIGCIAAGIAGAARAGVAEGAGESENSCWKIGLSTAFKTFSVVVVVSILSAFIPSKPTMYMMLGVKTTDHVVNSELGQKLQKVIDLQIEEYLGKLTPKK